MMDTRAATPVVGNILLVAVGIVMATVLAVVAFSILGASDPGPQASFDASHQNGTVTIVHESGDPIPAEEIRVQAGNETIDAPWSSSPVEAGDELRTRAPTLGETVRVTWLDPQEDQSQTLYEYEVPSTGGAVVWGGSSGSVDSFKSQFDGFSRQTDWSDGSGYVYWTQSQNPGQAYTEYRQQLPAGTDSVEVTIDFRTSSYEASGVHVYAVDNDGTEHTLWCDGSSNFHGGNDENINACGDLGNSYTWDGTKTASDPSGIAAVYFVVDSQENTANGDPEELRQFEVRTDG